MQPPLPFPCTSKSCYLGLSDNHPLVVTQQVQKKGQEKKIIPSAKKPSILIVCSCMIERNTFMLDSLLTSHQIKPISHIIGQRPWEHLYFHLHIDKCLHDTIMGPRIEVFLCSKMTKFA